MFTLGGRGNWTTNGCEVARIDGNIVICHCNHLTNFGVLVVRKVHKLQLHIVPIK